MSTFVILLLLGAPPLARVEVEALPTGWEPIRARDLEAAAGAAAVESISKAGLLRFDAIALASERRQRLATSDAASDASPGTAVLRVALRLVGGSGAAYVAVSLTPVEAGAWPSLSASESALIVDQPQRVMLERISAAARTAGERLAQQARPYLRGDRALPQVDLSAPSPFAAPPIVMPPAPPKDRARDLALLADRKQPAHLRAAALRALAPDILARPAIQDAVARCVLEEPNRDLRLRCAESIRYATRRHPALQDLVLAALAREREAQVQAVLVQASALIEGPAREAAAQVWLGLLARCSALSTYVVHDVVTLVRGEGDPPNLDRALAQCLALPAELGSASEKKLALDMIEELPLARRRALVWPTVVRGVGPRPEEGDEYIVWKRALEPLIPRYGLIDPELQAVMMKLVDTTTRERVREDLIDELAEHGIPGAPLVELLLAAFQTATNTSLSMDALSGLQRLAREAPALQPTILARLRQLHEDSAYAKPASHTTATLERTLKELTR